MYQQTRNSGFPEDVPWVMSDNMDPRYLYQKTYGSPHGVTDKGSYQNRTDEGPFTDNLGMWMDQQQEILNSRVEMLTYEIDQRQRMKDKNLYEIDLNQCTCRNIIYLMGNDDRLNTMRIDLERKIIDLDQEKRREKTSCFRDVVFLQKELRDSLIERLEEEQKVKMISTE